MSLRVLLAAPVRNRAWVLPAYLESVASLEVPAGVTLDCHFLVNNSTDASAAMLERFRDAVAGRLAVTVEEWTGAYAPAAAAERTPERPDHYGYLAALRNTLAARCLAGGYDYLFSLDSDILLAPTALGELLAAERDAVSAPINNDEFWALPRRFRGPNLMRYEGDGYSHWGDHPVAGVFPVDVTGACILIRRVVLEADCRWAAHPSGEDIPFCEAVRSKGFGLYCNADVAARHLYNHRSLLPGDTLARLQPSRITALDRGRTDGSWDVTISAAALEELLRRNLGQLLPASLVEAGMPRQSELVALEWDGEGRAVRVRLRPTAPRTEGRRAAAETRR